MTATSAQPGTYVNPAQDNHVDWSALIAQIDQHTQMMKTLLEASATDRSRIDHLTQAVESLTSTFGQYLQTQQPQTQDNQAQPQVQDPDSLLRRSWDRFVDTLTQLRDRMVTEVNDRAHRATTAARDRIAQNPLIQRAAGRTAGGLDMAVAGMDRVAARLIAAADRANEHARSLHGLAAPIAEQHVNANTEQQCTETRPPAENLAQKPKQEAAQPDPTAIPEAVFEAESLPPNSPGSPAENNRTPDAQDGLVDFQDQDQDPDSPQADAPPRTSAPRSELAASDQPNLLKVVAWPAPAAKGQQDGPRVPLRPTVAPPATAFPAPGPRR